MSNIRKATLDDIEFLWELEKNSFNPAVQFNKKSIARSLQSSNQQVWIIEDDYGLIGSATIRITKHAMRLYSIAINPIYQEKGYGRMLMQFLIQQCRAEEKNVFLLEADAKNINLIRWYESFGFRIVAEYIDYYGTDHPAFRMSLSCCEKNTERKLKNIVVVDQRQEWLESIPSIDLVMAEDYITNMDYKETKGLRIFNLCNSYSYQSMGYYVSLLATARNHRVIPNVAIIKDFSDSNMIEFIGDEVQDLIERQLNKVKEHTYIIRSYFGYTEKKTDYKLAKAMLRLFEAPMIECVFEKRKRWELVRITPLTFDELEVTDSLIEAAHRYFNQKRFAISIFRDYKYDLAILVDPFEKTPPSNKVALAKFKKAADDIGFYTEFITKEDYHRIPEFDALFIRTTTNVNDYTYRFSRFAYAQGLVVIDDPWSILKCSNKLYFHESMKKVGVLTPKSMLINQNTNLDDIVDKIGFPMVLKEPDNAFSLGVFKVKTVDELDEILNQILKKSDLVIAQEFLPSSFDWRIGIIDSKPIFACKYHMAKNHWQIYNWKARTRHDKEGLIESIPLEAVPKSVVKTALKAANAMGDGFYGVDMKEVNGKVYAIEVNDNPNVDYRAEDRILKDALYIEILNVMMKRIDQARIEKRVISNNKQ